MWSACRVADDPTSLHDRVGGEHFFRALVDRFYDGVLEDPVLRPLYPEEDLPGARDRLALFLVQFWGGPATYNEQRGHPRLRMRHAPFTIGTGERDAWLRHMTAAVDAAEGLGEVERAELLNYFTSAADFMINAAPEQHTFMVNLRDDRRR
jgi:hemoglobin